MVIYAGRHELGELSLSLQRVRYDQPASGGKVLSHTFADKS